MDKKAGEKADENLGSMNAPVDQLNPSGSPFVLGVIHAFYQALGERSKPRLVREASKPWITRLRPGPVIVQPGAVQFHPYAPGSDEETDYARGCSYAAQRLQDEFKRAQMLHELRMDGVRKSN